MVQKYTLFLIHTIIYSFIYKVVNNLSVDSVLARLAALGVV